METDWAISLLKELLWSSMLIAGPLLISTLIVGVAISVVQVATQIQEMTLSYVPKLMTSAIVLMLLGGWMISRLSRFAIQMIALIPGLG